MRHQESLFPSGPRAAPVKRMHVVDAGTFPDGSRAAEFQCARCGHASGWQRIDTVTKAKRGIPCPRCNRPAQAKEG